MLSTFEALGNMCGQPTLTETGVRAFGGHSARVTGAQTFAALGLEINKVRLMARHSGDTIMRYVADAPLRSLRVDLGLDDPTSSAALVAKASPARTPPGLAAKISGLEDMLERLTNTVRSRPQIWHEHRSRLRQRLCPRDVSRTRPRQPSMRSVRIMTHRPYAAGRLASRAVGPDYAARQITTPLWSHSAACRGS